MRVPGIILSEFALVWLSRLAWRAEWGPDRLRLLGIAGLYADATVGATTICWPYLWENLLIGFHYALRVTSHVPWPGTAALYWARPVLAPALPRHYLPVWDRHHHPGTLRAGCFGMRGRGRTPAVAEPEKWGLGRAAR